MPFGNRENIVANATPTKPQLSIARPSAGPAAITTEALPIHPQLRYGKLDNGLRYIILPNQSPAGKFEAHLEVLSGSAHELQTQQGMAHLLEHVAWMGSPKRQAMSGTGSKANAYTDFHHTVFYASCPTVLPGNRAGKRMLPLAFDALVDVMSTTVTSGRLEKERAVVLSEASMVNTMDYRVEIQILSALHKENRISKRFPIGQIPLIKKWTVDEVQQYHDTHYRPDNAILYVVGDVNPLEVEQTIEEKFGPLKPKFDAEEFLRSTGEYPKVSMRDLSPHFPPVVHDWTTRDDDTKRYLPEDHVGAQDLSVLVQEELNANDPVPVPTIFQHELMQAFSFHLFAKRPIEPVVDVLSLKRELMRKIAIASLQIRFNVVQRTESLFISVEFNQTNWPREGCAVCSLDLNADVSRWEDAIVTAVQEIRRLGIHGISENELARYKSAILAESEMLAAQSGLLESENVVQWIMEATAVGHAFMHPDDSLRVTKEALTSITLEEVNGICRELCEHLSGPDPTSGVVPSAIIACAPGLDRNGRPFQLSADAVRDVIRRAIATDIEPMVDIPVPETLFTMEELQAAAERYPPEFVEFVPKVPPGWGVPGATLGIWDPNTGVMQRRLQNGIAVNLKSMPSEPQRGTIRFAVAGGRAAESPEHPGAMTLGARTMQECGGFGEFRRESVELFCIDHLLMVEILSHQDMFTIDFAFPTTPGGATGQVTGLEAAMQVLHVILRNLEWEEDGFVRAKQALHQSYQSTMKNLDLACQETVVKALTDGCTQYIHPNHEQIDALTLDIVKQEIGKLFANTANFEVTLSADAPIEVLEALTKTYLGTIPERGQKAAALAAAVPYNEPLVKSGLEERSLRIYLNDSDERAMGYLGGYAPNHWGVDRNGRDIGEILTELSNSDVFTRSSDADVARRQHPLFGHTVLSIFREVATRRLFSIVREERQLTYDASFQFQGFDRIRGGMYQVSVTTSPQQADLAVQACREALASLVAPFGVTQEAVEAAKRTLLAQYELEKENNRYWCEVLIGTQQEEIPQKQLNVIQEYADVVRSITVTDVQLLAQYLGFGDGTTLSCVGISAPDVNDSIQGVEYEDLNEAIPLAEEAKEAVPPA
uniref:Uncharacterized protein n=1 Tax=Eutreptiella gymnastica TaxID=73025 RepID=A0A7S1NQ93_9EUGL